MLDPIASLVPKVNVCFALHCSQCYNLSHSPSADIVSAEATAASFVAARIAGGSSEKVSRRPWYEPERSCLAS